MSYFVAGTGSSIGAQSGIWRPPGFAIDATARRLAPGSVMAMMMEPQMWDGHLVLVHSSEQLGFVGAQGPQ